MLRVSSIFYSIQGEGAHSGEAGVFVRLYGCNLDCDFCDDQLHKSVKKQMSFGEILKEIERFPSKSVIITGGEPSIYNLNPFISFLHKYSYKVSIETNGYSFKNIKKADWITYSPKEWHDIKEEGFDELKFVVDKNSPIEKLLDIHSVKPIYLQPQNFENEPNMENVKFCIEVVKKYPQKFRFSAQMHKFLGIS